MTLSSSVYAQQKSDISGCYHIQADGNTEAKGTYLHSWTHGKIVTDKDYEDSAFDIKLVGKDERKGKEAGLYHLSLDGVYLTVKNGKVVGDKKKPSDTDGRWIVWEGSKGWAITYYDDETKGANALSLVSKDDGKTIGKPSQEGRYDIVLARNNAGGRGNQHQIWKLKKEN